MSRFSAYAAAGAALAFIGLALWANGLKATNEALTARVALLTAERNSLAARLTNIQEDRESDEVIDRLSNDELRHVPDGWRVR